MQKDNEINKINKASIIGLGLCVSFLLLVVSYWIAAIIGFTQTDSLSIIAAVGKVFSDPFAKYFNDYTPILMALSLIVSEFLFYLLLSKSQRNAEVCDNDGEDIILRENKDKEENLSDSELFQGIVDNKRDIESEISADVMKNFEIVMPDILDTEGRYEITDSETAEVNDDEIPAEVEYSSEIVAELMGEYEMEQIYAMLHITNYVQDVTTEMLKAMFKPTMSAEEIKDYIDIFYG